jgi:hypothetical protein
VALVFFISLEVAFKLFDVAVVLECYDKHLTIWRRDK